MLCFQKVFLLCLHSSNLFSMNFDYDVVSIVLQARLAQSAERKALNLFGRGFEPHGGVCLFRMSSCLVFRLLLISCLRLPKPLGMSSSDKVGF